MGFLYIFRLLGEGNFLAPRKRDGDKPEQPHTTLTCARFFRRDGGEKILGERWAFAILVKYGVVWEIVFCQVVEFFFVQNFLRESGFYKSVD